jgi:hypothetical protein
MLYREIIAVCSEIHTKHIVWAERGIFDVKSGGIYCNHWTAKCVKPFKQYHKPELHLNTQSVPRSKHTPSRLQKPVS